MVSKARQQEIAANIQEAVDSWRISQEDVAQAKADLWFEGKTTQDVQQTQTTPQQPSQWKPQQEQSQQQRDTWLDPVEDITVRQPEIQPKEWERVEWKVQDRVEPMQLEEWETTQFWQAVKQMWPDAKQFMNRRNQALADETLNSLMPKINSGQIDLTEESLISSITNTITRRGGEVVNIKDRQDTINDIRDRMWFSVGTDLDKINQETKYDRYNANVSWERAGWPEEISTLKQKVTDYLEQEGIDYDEAKSQIDIDARYEEIINNPDYKNANSMMNESKKVVDDLEEQKFNLLWEIDEAFPWEPSFVIDAVYSDRLEDINKQLRTATITHNKNVANYQFQEKLAQQKLSNYIQEYQINQDQLWKTISQETGIAKADRNQDWTNFYKQQDREDQKELQQLSLLSQLNLKGMSDSNIDWLDTTSFVKDILKFKSQVDSKQKEQTNMYYDENSKNMVFYDNYGNVINTYSPQWWWTTTSEWTSMWVSPENIPEWWLRTDRHRNPTALMYTEWVAKFFKNKWYNVSKWDKFPDSNNYTLDMSNIDDPVQATIDYIDAYWFDYKGQNRRTHTSMSDESRNNLNNQQKRWVIKKMYSRELGSWELFWENYIAWAQRSNSYNKNLSTTYREFIVNGKSPSVAVLKSDFGWSAEELWRQANNWFKDNIWEVLGGSNVNMKNPQLFTFWTKEQRDWSIEWMKTINKTLWWIEQVVDYIENNFEDWKIMYDWWRSKLKTLRGKITNLQLWVKDKWLYNLWVLNWPDLELIESVIPNVNFFNPIPIDNDNYITKEEMIERMKETAKTFVEWYDDENILYWINVTNPFALDDTQGGNVVWQSNPQINEEEILKETLNSTSYSGAIEWF